MKNLRKNSEVVGIKKALSACTAFFVIASSNLIAGDDQQQGFTLAPALGFVTHSASKQGVDDAVSASIAAGYQFGNPWALELAYTASQPDAANGPGDVDATQIRLDSLYHFGASGKSQPYAVFGIGNSDFSSDFGDVDETMLNVGVGIKYAMTEALSFRSDIRAHRGEDSESTEAALNVGLHYLFGATSSPKSRDVVVKDSDSDGDGVFDRLDRCPGTPANTKVSSDGCTVDLDSDGDGVLDSADRCPDSERGAKVDEKGCYRILKEDVRVELNIQFANNSDVVVSDSFEQLDSLAKFMREFPATQVEIKGHTDDRGAADYNKRLSQKRAEAVAAILVEKYSVDASRISARGYGEEQPKATNDTASGREQNRRVEGVVTATVEKVLK